MDVVGGFVLFGVLVGVLWLVGEMWQRRREALARARRKAQVRKADKWRFDLEEHEALVAMRRVADDVGETKP